MAGESSSINKPHRSPSEINAAIAEKEKRTLAVLSKDDLDALRARGLEPFHVTCLLDNERHVANTPIVERTERYYLQMDAEMELVGLFKVIHDIIGGQWGANEFDHETWTAAQAICRRGMELASSSCRDADRNTIEEIREVVTGPAWMRGKPIGGAHG